MLTMPNVSTLHPLTALKIPLTLIPIEQVIELEKERPKPPPLKFSMGSAGKAGSAGIAPVLSPTEMQANPPDMEVAEPSLEPPEFGMISPLYDRPPLDEREQIRLEPVASPLPDVLSMKSNEGSQMPPAAIPAPISQRGAVYRGAGAPDLDVATTPSYTGPNLDLPVDGVPSTGSSHGSGVSGGRTPGGAIGEGHAYTSGVGRSEGTGAGTGTGLEGTGNDLIGEGDISGLLRWLRDQHSAFPAVVMSYMGTRESDLRGLAQHGGWDIFIQFSEAEHQLKIFLSRGSSGILLADSDFKNRSQYFGLGSVSRELGTISGISATRDKATAEHTEEFYRVFANWMKSTGIDLGTRGAK
jgi:hypothetical protein